MDIISPLIPQRQYLFIDCVYLHDLQDHSNEIPGNTLLTIRSAIFPYTCNPYALLTADETVFNLDRITYLKAEDCNDYNLNQFCSDSGLILVVEVGILSYFLSMFVVDKFIDYLTNPHLLNYWSELKVVFQDQIHYFFTSDISNDFAGGGNFQIINSH